MRHRILFVHVMINAIIQRIRKIKNDIFSVRSFPQNIESFKEYVSSIDDKQLDDVDRSYLSFSIRMKYSGYSIFRLFAIYSYYTISLIGLILLIFFRRKINIITPQSNIYYKVSNNQGILPKRFMYSTNIHMVEMGAGMLWDKDIELIIKTCIRKRYINVGFIFECLFSLLNYAYIVKVYNPQNIITSYESAPAVSILTKYCSQKKVRHINIMHGEKLYTMNNILGHFDIMYVWDEYYIDLFQKLRYKCNEYLIENPWSQLDLPNPNDLHDITLYLNYVKYEDIQHIREIVHKVKQRKQSIYVRMHPSQFNSNFHREIEKFVHVEDITITSIFQSLSNTKYVLSQYSTVLFQGYSLGKEIVIDDMTNKSQFEKLSKCNYIMLSKPHKLLSDFVSEL